MVTINDIKIYLMQNEGNSVAAERFISTLKNKVCKYSQTPNSGYAMNTGQNFESQM